MTRIIAALAAFVMGAAGEVSAEVPYDESGNALHRHCQNERPEYSYVYCAGYVSGVWQGDQGRYICAPEEATNGQARNIVKRYLERHPEKRHEHMGALVITALSGAWPCKKSQP